jgi:hypothetical protein
MTETQSAVGTEGAAAELETARTELEGVVEKIAGGRATERDLEAAERRVRFCEARLEGARRREVEEAEEERLKALEDLAQRTGERLAAVDVEKRRKAAEKALDAYVAACMAHNEAIDQAVDELLSQEELPQGFAVREGRDGHGVAVGGKEIRRLRPMVEVREMGLEVLGRHWRRGYISLGDDAY